MATGINCMGHGKYYERLFKAMHFWITALTFSGLRRMLGKKEYGQMYIGLKRVCLHCRLVTK
jgi:hypothetical protein